MSTDVTQQKRAPVLYVEDEENDAILVRFGFQRAEVNHPLKVLNNGRLAIDYLKGNGEFSDRQRHPLPCLVLLDLNLPLVSGLEVLQWLRNQEHLKDLPVVIFSSSAEPIDKERAEALRADAYVVKEPNLDKLSDMVRGLKTRWLDHCP